MFSRILQVICFLGFVQYPQVDHRGLFSMGYDMSGRYSYDTMYATKFECRQVHGRTMCRDWDGGRVDAHGFPLHMEGFVGATPADTVSSVDVLVGLMVCTLALAMCYCAMKMVMKLFRRKECKAVIVLLADTPSTDSGVVSTGPTSEVVLATEPSHDDILTSGTCEFNDSLEEASVTSESEVEAMLFDDVDDDAVDDVNDVDDNVSSKLFPFRSS